MLKSRRLRGLRPPEPPTRASPWTHWGPQGGPRPLPLLNTLYFCLATPLTSENVLWSYGILRTLWNFLFWCVSLSDIDIGWFVLFSLKSLILWFRLFVGIPQYCTCRNECRPKYHKVKQLYFFLPQQNFNFHDYLQKLKIHTILDGPIDSKVTYYDKCTSD